jgi:ketosteroid isomerase-like protein
MKEAAVRESAGVREGIMRFYERFSSADADVFARGIAEGPGVSVIGTAPGEGHDDRESWIEAYRTGIAELGLTLRGNDPRGYEEGTVGWGTDRPSFVLPDGRHLPTRLTAVLRLEDGEWRIVHLHFSVGVPDEDAIEEAES